METNKAEQKSQWESTADLQMHKLRNRSRMRALTGWIRRAHNAVTALCKRDAQLTNTTIAREKVKVKTWQAAAMRRLNQLQSRMNSYQMDNWDRKVVQTVWNQKRRCQK